ncbi:hypothetical protein Ahy_B10g104494 [Arachis hypogaea]|uniref:Uncharacterized protein n=1 Tax=Arachis hypogaea TaxID=3818 RepID=A0A444X5P7_ARAHY|nr:hypothetical protein Ahy_B10g104494 [Arachis hypogaea]
MENNARKSQELDVRMETQGLQLSQLAYSNSNNNTSNDPKSLPGESVALLNNLSSQQTPNAWQPPSNKDQNLGLLSSSYVKKELSEFFTEQQHRQNISKMHGLHSGGANQGTIKDELSRGVPASRSMAPTTSTGFNVTLLPFLEWVNYKL